MAAGLALAGCYGTTLPAGDLHPDRATLNARGAADAGAASVWFEYWPTASRSDVTQTDRRSVPAGAAGPVAQPIVPEFLLTPPLRQSTSYSYRMCGSDATHEPVCAQTETFTTPRGDALDGGTQYTGAFRVRDLVEVSAWSGPSGESPGGTLTVDNPQYEFAGRVTCLSVHGTTAAAGAVGTWRSHVAGGPPPSTKRALLELQATGTAGNFLVDRPVLSDGGAPPACSAAPSATLAPYGADWVIQDG